MSLNQTDIEWVFNPDGSRPGYSWNPITGCLNHKGGLCLGGGFPCYAYQVANGRVKNLYLANKEITQEVWIMNPHEKPFIPRFWEKRLKDVTPFQKPKGIFCCDMSDLFGRGVPEAWTISVLNYILATPQHKYYLLTKQPARMLKYSRSIPPNCNVGVTATNPDILANAVNTLMNIQASFKYISIEPLLKWNNLDIVSWLKQIDWLIIGAQTKPNKYPPIAWLKFIVDQANEAGIRVFLKNNLMPLIAHHKYPEWAITWDGDGMRLRQDPPGYVEERG